MSQSWTTGTRRSSPRARPPPCPCGEQSRTPASSTRCCELITRGRRTPRETPPLFLFFFLIIPRPPRSTLFPYTTLFRSVLISVQHVQVLRRTRHRHVTVIFHTRSAPGRALFRLDQDDAVGGAAAIDGRRRGVFEKDRKSTRLNSSHRCISYAVFCLKKKN